MLKNPKITLVVAIYNIEKYLRECVDSILAQTYDNFEVILVDDGSTDDSGSIADEYAKKDKRVRVVHQRNQGLSGARNRGIKEATAEYITFVDGDDYLDKQYLKKLWEKLSYNDADVAVCNFQRVPSLKQESFNNKVMDGIEAAVKLLTEQEDYQIVTWNKLYKKDLFKKIKFPVGSIHEDSLTTYKILAMAKIVVFDNTALYFYREREGSIMNKVKIKERLDSKMKAAHEARKYFVVDAKLLAAAEISELLAYFAFLDNIIAGRLKIEAEPYFAWLKDNKDKLLENQFLTKKLKIYLMAATSFGGILYRFYRKIKN